MFFGYMHAGICSFSQCRAINERRVLAARLMLRLAALLALLAAASALRVQDTASYKACLQSPSTCDDMCASPRKPPRGWDRAMSHPAHTALPAGSRQSCRAENLGVPRR